MGNQQAAAGGQAPPSGSLVSYCGFCESSPAALEAKEYCTQMSKTYDNPDDQMTSMRKIAEFAGKSVDNAVKIAQARPVSSPASVGTFSVLSRFSPKRVPWIPPVRQPVGTPTRTASTMARWGFVGCMVPAVCTEWWYRLVGVLDGEAQECPQDPALGVHRPHHNRLPVR